MGSRAKILYKEAASGIVSNQLRWTSWEALAITNDFAEEPILLEADISINSGANGAGLLYLIAFTKDGHLVGPDADAVSTPDSNNTTHTHTLRKYLPGDSGRHTYGIALNSLATTTIGVALQSRISVIELPGTLTTL